MAELLRMPEIAANTTEAVLSSWPLPENTAFARDDVIATVETAKAVVDVSAESDGVLLKTLVAPGAEVAIGAAIALIGAPGEQVPDLDAVLAELGVGVGAPAKQAAAVDPVDVPEAAPSNQPAPPVSTPVEPAASSNGQGRVFASPLARRLARRAGLSLDQLTGTGPNGRVLRRDVEHAQATSASSSGAAPQPSARPAAFTDVPHTKLRRLVAARLTESKQTAPHFYLRGTARVDRLLALRAELNDSSAEVRVSVNDLVVKAVAQTHLLVPAMNVTWGPDAVRSYASVDIAVAVATESGLVTPVLRSVEQMTVTTVARTMRDYVERAGAGRLRQHELEGGSISVTNLGMYGTEEFAAIINPPQAAILAVGAAREEPVVIDGELRVGRVMRLTLSVDHRPVDGVVAAQWMRSFVDLLEHPARILA